MAVIYRYFTVKCSKLAVTSVTYKSNQNNYLILYDSSEEETLCIDNVIRTPTLLDMFLQTNFDKTAMKIIHEEPCNYLTFCIGLNQLM